MDEEMKRNMQFITEHQAQFAVSQQKHEERILELEAAQVQLTQSQAHMNQVMAHLGDAMIELSEAQARSDALMAESQARTDARMAESQARTDARMAETDERLNNLILVVERYISRGTNGNA